MEKTVFTTTAVQALIRTKMKTVVVVVATTVSAAVLSGLVWFYMRRKWKNAPTATKSKKDGAVAQLGAKRGPSPAVGLPSKPSSSSLVPHPRRRGSTSRSASGSVAGQLAQGQQVGGTLANRQYVFMHAGVESLTDSLTQFERSVRVLRESKLVSRQDRELLEGLENALESIRQLHNDVSKLLERYCPEALEEMSVASTLTPMGSQYALYEGSSRVRRTLSVLSDDSYASALDELIPSFPEVEAPVYDTQALPFEDLELYQIGWTKAQQGEVQCRCLRTEFLHCISDDDFLAKLYCVREALSLMMQDEHKRSWIADAGRDLIKALLLCAGKDPSGFCKSYDAMLGFINATDDWGPVEDELNYRKVPQISFYDVVLDFILMDAFDDLAHPPASVLAVAQNRFLSASFKEATLSTVVWSVIKAKRTRLQYSRAFIAHFYDISEQVSPTMAWGFLGTDEKLRDVCYYFKDQVCNFLSDIFSVDRVRYTNVSDLSDDIYQICQCRIIATKQRLMPKSENGSPDHLENGFDASDAK